MSQGHLIHGPDGTAGEMGHLVVEIDGPPCGCGGYGHVEAICSGTALAREGLAAARSGASAYLRSVLDEHGQDAVDARAIASGEDAGDATCRTLLEHARKAFAAACVSVVNVLNPEAILVGGSIAEYQADKLLEPARRAIRSDAFDLPGSRVRVVAPELGADVSLAGAHPLVLARLAHPEWGREPAAAGIPAPA